MKGWKNTRPGIHAKGGWIVGRFDPDRDVWDPKGRAWAASRRDGTMVQAEDLRRPYEGINLFKTMKDAQWFLEVHDND